MLFPMFGVKQQTPQATQNEVRNRCGSQTPQTSSDNVGFTTTEIVNTIGFVKQQPPTTQQNSQARIPNLSLPLVQRQLPHQVQQNKTPKKPKDSGADDERHDATTGDEDAEGRGADSFLRSNPEPDADSIPPLHAQNKATSLNNQQQTTTTTEVYDLSTPRHNEAQNPIAVTPPLAPHALQQLQKKTTL